MTHRARGNGTEDAEDAFSPPPSRTDWKKVYDLDFLVRPRCWETCGGGFCCNPSRVQRHFSFLSRNGVVLPHLPGEYHYLKRSGSLQAGLIETYARHDIHLNNGKSFPIYHALCTLNGLCSAPSYRPLVCRTYPFMPVPNVAGEVERLEQTALIDLYWDHLEQCDRPCTIDNLLPEEEKSFYALCAELFKDPVNIFYYSAASIYKSMLLTSVVDRYPKMLKQPEDQFFKNWEKMLVMGWLYRPERLIEELTGLYERLEAYWGSVFTLEGL